DVFAGKKSAQIREILISESAWEEMTCLFAPSKGKLATALPLAQLLAQDAVEVVRRASSERNLSHQCATAVRRLT
ncbi:hypothetical protein ABS821_25785, partial [Klebsiella pneumoniae]|nr:hypothetical protein [Enterobacter mori]MBT1917986.1 hypothetical protein [Enterobacter hormaechei subsp. xiangfangensis]HCR0253855.1 hypothetical protein [Enterobacter hormaechei]HCR0407615.1 hypothetical protein [Enterobacter hormaechei]HCR1102228.1 hypothetical protein [Enterobacter hormaechei]